MEQITQPQIGFFEEAPGQKSSTRLQIFILVINGALVADLLVGIGLYKYISGSESLTGIVTAASSYLAANVIPLIIWKSIAKNQESKP